MAANPVKPKAPAEVEIIGAPIPSNSLSTIYIKKYKIYKIIHFLSLLIIVSA
jgi:hypothetical protein